MIICRPALSFFTTQEQRASQNHIIICGPSRLRTGDSCVQGKCVSQLYQQPISIVPSDGFEPTPKPQKGLVLPLNYEGKFSLDVKDRFIVFLNTFVGMAGVEPAFSRFQTEHVANFVTSRFSTLLIYDHHCDNPNFLYRVSVSNRIDIPYERMLLTSTHGIMWFLQGSNLLSLGSQPSVFPNKLRNHRRTRTAENTTFRRNKTLTPELLLSVEQKGFEPLSCCSSHKTIYYKLSSDKSDQ